MIVITCSTTNCNPPSLLLYPSLRVLAKLHNDGIWSPFRLASSEDQVLKIGERVRRHDMLMAWINFLRHFERLIRSVRVLQLISTGLDHSARIFPHLGIDLRTLLEDPFKLSR